MDAEAMGSVAAGAAGKLVLRIVSCFRVHTQSIALRSVLIYSHMQSRCKLLKTFSFTSNMFAHMEK